jgi:hypothetical protein
MSMSGQNQKATYYMDKNKTIPEERMYIYMIYRVEK